MMVEYVDILQVGARNMQNFDLLKDLGKIRKPVLLKRGLSATIEELILSAEYILAGGNMNVMTMIGIIMLMGLVTKNGILLVDFTNQEREIGHEREHAILSAARTRIRPIIMTTVAMIFGMIPLALAIGAGAEQRAPMARAVIGGLITSTLLTLFVVPVMYTLLDDLSAWLTSRGRSGESDAPPHPEPIGMGPPVYGD